MTSGRLWDKGAPMDQKILEFTVGNDPQLDARLVQYDILGTIAHVHTLERAGYLVADEADRLKTALAEIGAQFESGEWQIEVSQEDCHTAIEQQLTVRLGALGGKVHLGRSRNDQVLTAIRLYLKVETRAARSRLLAVCAALDRFSSVQGQIPIPGYTHMQQAMPSTVGLWAQGFRSELQSNDRLLEVAHQLADLCPLGSAAGYGTPGINLDRSIASVELGFSTVQEPVTAPQLSRGKAEGALAYGLWTVLNDLGRLAADVCLFSTQEFGFFKLASDVSTGSSIMPQKRNPDVFELVRGHSSQAWADFQAVSLVAAKLPSGYHRDLQLIKEPLFRMIDRAALVMDVVAYAIGRIECDASRAAFVTSPSIHAAEKAFALVVQEGVSFREAYRRIALSEM